jgi:2-(1,2-epoxy-1,2-dihydrophenyl)acetyl-CoA isomerase
VSSSVLGSGLETLKCEVEDGVARLTLNRPDAMNAFNMQLKQELGQTLEECAVREEVRAVLLTGAGRAFSAGGDIVQMDPDRGPGVTRERMRKLLHGTVFPLARLEKPVVAAVNGHCHGLGLSLAMACDIVYAAESAVFSMAFTKVGLVPDGAAIYFLPRLVGLNRAKELVLTARRFGAAEASEIGLVTRVIGDDELLDAAMQTARELASGATLALGLSKRLLDQAPQLSLDDAAELEAYAQAIMMASADHAEGVAAFREKRAPRFRGS